MTLHKCEGCGRKVLWLEGQDPLGWQGNRCRRCIVIGGLFQ